MKKILEITRSNIVERAHLGALMLFGNGKVLAEFGHGEPDDCYYLRSCAKPLQASVCADLGVFEHFGFSQDEIAILCASHSGSFENISTVEGILEKLDLDISYLQCGVHMPLDRESREYLIKNDLKPNPLHHNCSGKHAGFLAACVKEGWDLPSYLDINHPLQQQIYSRIGVYCEYGFGTVSKDGCGAPIVAMPFENMCRGFLNCFENYSQIKEAMSQKPYMMGGHNRIDSEIVFATKGRLIAKVGAEGLCMVYNSELHQTLLVNILDSNEQARAVVLIQAMLDLGWISKDEIENNPLKSLFEKQVKTQSGDVVGEIRPTFNLKSLVETF
jgi:L-asparaginase II